MTKSVQCLGMGPVRELLVTVCFGLLWSALACMRIQTCDGQSWGLCQAGVLSDALSDAQVDPAEMYAMYMTGWEDAPV
jgi:hypothetical protein